MENKNTPLTQPAIRLGSFVLECKAPKDLAGFYSKLLGVPLAEESDGWCIIKLPGSGIELSFQRDEEYQPPVWPGSGNEQQMMAHLDLFTKDRLAAVEYAVALGAVVPPVQYCEPEWNQQWTTLLDPAGHPFCLCDDHL
ncbi:MAG: VOC family protein [Oscillospiraceae bacterium]